ncbi:MAG: cytochrome c oxidase subunit II [Myxococcota bacterium]
MSEKRAPLIGFLLVFIVLGILWIWYPFGTPLLRQSTIFPLTENAETTQWIYGLVYWITLAIFLGVEGLLVYALFRFRRRGDETALPSQTHGHTPLEIGWTLATVLLVLVMYVPSCQAIRFHQGPPAQPNPLIVDVTGRQWFWEFYYPEFDLTTANEIAVPQGRTVLFNVTSTDVIHSFWFPRMGGKRDAVPGRTQPLWFTPTELGTFAGQCTEYCGSSHALMKMEIVVKAKADFDAWVAQQKAPADPASMAGFGMFAASGCIACHMTMANDKTVLHMNGPNLMKVASRQKIAAGILDNTPENLKLWISNPQHVKPDAKMNVPAMQCTGPGQPDACCRDVQIGNCLPDASVDQLVSYLQMMK